MPQLRDIEAIKTLAENVRLYRVEKKLTQETLAFKAGIEYSQISRLERGLLNTSVSVIYAVAKALEIEPGRLLDKTI